MPSVFLSHCSTDKQLARQIANDLQRSGINVWLDEWEILVGDSIAQRISQGIEESDFVAVLLSHHSIDSGWVEKEWQAKIGREAAERQAAVLPLKADDCVVPILLQDKRYADVANDYGTAIGELVAAVQGHVARRNGTDGNLAHHKNRSQGSHSFKFTRLQQATLSCLVFLIAASIGWVIYSGRNGSESTESTTSRQNNGSNVFVSGDVNGDVNYAERDIIITKDASP